MNNKVLIGILLLVLVGAGAFFLFKNNANPYKSTQTQQSQAVVTTIPSPTATASPSGTMKDEKNTIVLTDEGFNPKLLTVKVGTKVVWVNKSGVTATVNSAIHPTHLVYPPLNLGNFENGASLSLVFDKVGTYKYHDHLNPSHNGSVVVE